MKQFFKFMLASMAGFILTTFLFLFFIFIIIASIASFASKEEVMVKPGTVLTLDLSEAIPERSPVSPFSFNQSSFLSKTTTPGLLETMDLLKKATEDENIRGIYLNLSDIPSGMATLEEIRNAILDFKQSGKFVIAYSETYSQKAYYMASAADIICLNPEGFIDFKGLTGQVLFLKGLLDKLDINAQVIRHGKYKSAIEPLISDRMSEANKEQTLTYVGSIWQHISSEISKARNIAPEKLQNIADSLLLQTAEDAVKYGFADKITYKDQVLDLLREKLELGSTDKIEFLKLESYKNSPALSSKKRSKDKIAIIYAVGEIGGGEGSDEAIGSERISRAIRKARLDDNVKAIVFRINSPGGSALASDVILREIKLAREKKPVVASMGDLAASGGYYIACAADTILANPTTLTGSIGVFGVIPDFQKFFSSKLGITFDMVKTNKNSDYISVTRPMTSYEEKVMTNSIERIYKTFIGHVSDGRMMTTAAVDSIGQGRVWSGIDGQRIHLVDEMGGLRKAIEIAAKMAKIEDYRLTSLPEQKDPFTELMEDITGSPSETMLRNELGNMYPYLKEIQSFSKMSGVQARLPFILDIN
ncbi:MAG: signal peptide peptidase SppA [Lentimicrobiaceae bacterium]|nr:signal peptide peptidase SppA [Lentimicrobiaceae bacterium]MCB9024107.1 signal peptide peptidase SppA [Lentimicrobiaceae bacterium]MCO5264893.1 signal peptide peptidase SppA [Lentimicrobium sp.]